MDVFAAMGGSKLTGDELLNLLGEVTDNSVIYERECLPSKILILMSLGDILRFFISFCLIFVF